MKSSLMLRISRSKGKVEDGMGTLISKHGRVEILENYEYLLPHRLTCSVMGKTLQVWREARSHDIWILCR